MLKLKLSRSGAEFMQMPLDQSLKNEFLIGREEGADIRLDDRAVGRKHALVLLGKDSVSVQKKSKFGKIFVNGSEVEECILKPGDEMAIADVLLQLINDEEPKVETRSAPTVTETPSAASIDAPSIEGMAELDTFEPMDLDAKPQSAEVDPKVAEQAFGAHVEQNLNNQVHAAAPESVPVVEVAPSVGSFGSFGNNESAPANDVGGGDKTAVLDLAGVTCQLVLPAGAANVQEFNLDKSEVSIGRGSDCDIILQDKKSSRKHVVIRKAGAQHVLVDLGSGNGTTVNGEKVTEHQLSGNDVIKIGDTEITFKAENQKYFQEQQNYISVPAVEETPPEEPLAQQNTDPNAGFVQEFGEQNQAALAQDFGVGQPGAGVAQIGGSFSGVPGIGNTTENKKETLLEKFKKQPPARKALIVLVIGAVLFFVFNEDEAPKQQKKPTAMSAEQASFSKLPKEKQQFIVNTYELAYNYYKNKQYDKALYEVEKILQILPQGYKESRDIKTYAQKAIDILKAREEEERRKEAEEKLKQEITQLVDLAQKLVDEGKDEEAKDVFTRVLEKDPENPTILRLRQQIDEKEKRLEAERQAERERELKRRQLLDLIEEGEKLLKEEKYYEAIEKMEDAPVIYSGDEKLLEKAKNIILEARKTLKEKAAPFLREAKEAFDGADFPRARDAFYKALEVDTRNTEAKEGLERIREILHDRSKKIYTEGVILEGVSDYQNARTKFKECLQQAMPDDVYFGRCQRKVKRFDLLDQTPALTNGVETLSIPASGLVEGRSSRMGLDEKSKDPEKPTLPIPVEVPPAEAFPETESSGSPVTDEIKKKKEEAPASDADSKAGDIGGFGE